MCDLYHAIMTPTDNLRYCEYMSMTHHLNLNPGYPGVHGFSEVLSFNESTTD